MANPPHDLEGVVRALQGVRAALRDTPLSSALDPPVVDVVVLYDTQSVGDALQTLAAWNILSAPVVKGGPPWLRRREAEAAAAAAAEKQKTHGEEAEGKPKERAASPEPPVSDVGANNPAMHDILGFLSVETIMRAVVAGALCARTRTVCACVQGLSPAGADA
jgi:hypothetical protein